MKTSRVIKRILHYAKPSLPYLLVSLLCSVIYVAASIYVPVIIGYAVDCIAEAGLVDFAELLKWLVIMIAAIAVYSVFQWLAGICTIKATHDTVRNIRKELFSHLSKMPLKYIDGTAHGDLTQRIISDAEMIGDGLLQGFTHFFSGIVTIIGTLAIMFTVNTSLALIVVCLTPISLVFAYFIAKKSHKSFLSQSQLRGEISGFAEEIISGQKTVKLYSQEAGSLLKFKEINDGLKKSGVKSQFYSSTVNPTTRFINSAIYVTVTVFGALSIIGGGPLSVGKLSSFLLFSNQYTKPFNEISGIMNELQTAVAAARRVIAVLDAEAEPDDSSLPVLKSCDGNVSLQNVAFSYTPEKELIKDLSLSVKKGEKIAIVGPTGSGKTTIINLLMRFYDTDGGSIEVSGRDIKGVTRKSLRSCYGMVLQDTWLFTGTVAQNIAYGKPEATRETIIEAATAAKASDFIDLLPDGYDTVISENGGNISEGQKQLLCIARVMLTRPPMTILDEATSNIDTRTELKIQSAFADVMRGKTSFIVAHRLSTIVNSDKIIVMDKGKIIELGTHRELLDKKGFYYKLYNSQFSI